MTWKAAFLYLKLYGLVILLKVVILYTHLSINFISKNIPIFDLFCLGAYWKKTFEFFNIWKNENFDHPIRNIII